MNVYLATAYPTPWTYLPLFQRLARQDRFGMHAVVEDAGQADIILFVDARHEHDDWQLTAVRQHALTRRYREKTFLYNEMDQPWCALPGLYVSMPAPLLNAQRQRAFCYAQPMNPYAEARNNAHICPDLLFSFMGRQCYSVRQRILQICHSRAHIEDTSRINFFGSGNVSAHERDAQQRRYADVLARSKFVLCPRGAGPASYRLFETMAMGRVPVILGDEWVPPAGPRWREFALFVPEKDVDGLPALLEACESRYEAMAKLARQEWMNWFAPDVLFHRMVENCKEILDKRCLPEAFWQRLPDRRCLRLQARVAKARTLERLKR